MCYNLISYYVVYDLFILSFFPHQNKRFIIIGSLFHSLLHHQYLEQYLELASTQ